jgi:peptide-methionine (S)-S-oxide reductase
MDNSDIKDLLFREAVEAIDNGNISSLQNLLKTNPELISKRLDTPTDGYFAYPYLMWFVAENPIRHEKLPANIIDVTRVLIDAVSKNAPKSFHEQINYTLGLIATGRIPRESGVQNEWIDLLIDNGATPGNGIGTLAHGNIAAAKHLIERGGTLTLATAVGLDLEDSVYHLLKGATRSDTEIALMMAAFYGKSKMISLLLNHGVNVNVYLERSSGFHSHATALHQAVFSGSLESVKLLVDAGADLNAKDRIYEGTPLGWAIYIQTEEPDEIKKKEYKVIENYLHDKLSHQRLF